LPNTIHRLEELTRKERRRGKQKGKAAGKEMLCRSGGYTPLPECAF